MIIQNTRQLGQTPERRIALRILESGYRAIDTQTVLQKSIFLKGAILHVQNERIDCSAYRRIGIIGIGKCAYEAGAYMEKILGKRIYGGLILDMVQGKLKFLKSKKGTHPLPSARNIGFAKQIVAFTKSLDPQKDLLIAFVSGGGSSLFFIPENIDKRDFIQLTRNLQKGGADIYELNCVRKHLSAVQGGKFARMLYPLPICVLYFSDVVGNDPNVIASGPLYQDNTSNADARRILRKYGLWNAYKNKVRYFGETPKQKKYFTHVSQHVVLTNTTALRAMAQEAKKVRLRPRIVDARFHGDANRAYATMKRMSQKDTKADVYIAGGETIVHVIGNGKGGRNQQTVLAALDKIKKNELFISAASDGIDNTPYAGAIADLLTREHARKLGLDSHVYVRNNNSYAFFSKTKDYIKTGKTGSNVADLMILYKTPRAYATVSSPADKTKK